MIDFHAHFLPNIDDGASSINESAEMLLLSYAQGVKTVIATPHFLSDKQTIKEFIENRNKSYNDLIEYINNNGLNIPEIKLGAEVSFDHELLRTDNLEELCIEGTGTLLVELPFTHWNEWLYDSLFEVTARKKIKIVLAHFERYVANKKSLKKLENLLNMDLLIQVNADSVIKKNKIAMELFKNYHVDAIGSDMHNMKSRISHIDKAKNIIIKRYGNERWNLISDSMNNLIN